MWTEKARPAPSGQAGPSAGVTGTPTLSVQESELVLAELEEGERVEAGFTGGSFRKRHFVATGSRVMVFEPEGFLGRTHTLHSFSYDEIDAIGTSKWGEFVLTAGGQRFASVPQLANDFMTFVRHRMPRPGPAELSELPAPSPTDGPGAEPDEPEQVEDSLSDQLAQLAALHADGMLTDAEFSLAKAQTLGVKPKAAG